MSPTAETADIDAVASDHLDSGPVQLRDAFWTFRPRPDQPERYDQQASFYMSRLPGVALLIGGNGAGCLAAEQPIYDPVLNVTKPVSEIGRPFHVWARTESGKCVIAKASAPKIYGVEDLYEITLKSGRRIAVTLGHRVWTDSGWKEIGDLVRPFRDALELCGSNVGVPNSYIATSFSLSGHSPDTPTGSEVICAPSIASIRFLRRDFYWDFSVEEHENYWLAGYWHHNTTECGVAKACDFMLQQQPPPREDTPFWVIAESYEQVCNAIWKEKMYGHGHIPVNEIDWERIRWNKPKQNWPYEVPLKPWRDRPGKNWCIKFKSYGQGREQMQAESIGGFLFSEQFPWGILEEVLRGCREYNFRGAKLCEFTPVDPLRSIELEEKIEDDKLPPGWQIFRANTECAMEAGHVAKEWFDEFFGLISEDMRAVRMIGAFASFEGTIYPQFNPAIHFLPEDWEPEVGYFHRRSIDWGFGPDNAFCCLWGCRDSVGRWYIYDEYYSTDVSRTVHDHLKAIADRWPWPYPNNWYGCTYADPSNLDGIRIANRFSEYHKGYTNFDMQGASNSVLEGIEHVKWLLQHEKAMGSPRLRILKSACPNLSRQMRTYRWERSSETGVNPRDAKPQPLKKNDHAVDALRYLVYSEANKQGIVPSAKRRQRDHRRFGIQMEGRK